MNDPERPPLDERTFEEIKDAIHKVKQRHWPRLIEMQVPNYHPLNIPVPPQRPLYFKDTVLAYALDLFEREADLYAPFREHQNYPPWLSRLADRAIKEVLDALEKIEEGNAKATFWYHGVTQPEIIEAVRLRLLEATNQYTWRDAWPHPSVTVNPAKTEFPNISEPQAPPVDNSAVDIAKVSGGNRERIDQFILKMAESGLKIKRKDIWRAAGYKDRTEFERFQRGEGRNKTASSNFNRILGLKSEDFSRLMNQKS